MKRGHDALYRDALSLPHSVFLLPRRDAPFPLVALEALAADVPVFCFESSGIAEFVPAEFICWDPDDMIAKVKVYLENMANYPAGTFRRIAEQRGPDGYYRKTWDRLFRQMRDA